MPTGIYSDIFWTKEIFSACLSETEIPLLCSDFGPGQKNVEKIDLRRLCLSIFIPKASFSK